MSYITEFCHTLRKSGIIEEFRAHAASLGSVTITGGVKKPQAGVSHWRHWHTEANKLPTPTMIDEWCISPDGVRFRVAYLCDGSGSVGSLYWELCALTGTPLGLLFRETRVR